METKTHLHLFDDWVKSRPLQTALDKVCARYVALPTAFLDFRILAEFSCVLMGHCYHGYLR
jgi:hypothetical protein